MSKLTFKEDEYSNLSDSQRGIIIALTSVINIRIVTQECLMDKLGVSNYKSYRRLIKTYSDNDILKEVYNSIFLNPIVLKKESFKWHKEIFDIFKESIKQNLSELEYLKLKANWYEVNHQITISNIKDMDFGVSGIYRLYYSNDIVYIGKSVNIRQRIFQHLKDKDIDSFDFTISNNNSDKNIMELCLIDKYKPLLNKDCIEKTISTLNIEESVFSNVIELTKESSI